MTNEEKKKPFTEFSLITDKKSRNLKYEYQKSAAPSN